MGPISPVLYDPKKWYHGGGDILGAGYSDELIVIASELMLKEEGC
jgi:hypothetical protein